MKKYKQFIYGTRNQTAMQAAKEIIEWDWIPMISVESLQKSKTYKEVDKFLLEIGCKKVFAEKDKKGSARYEYYK